MTTSRLTPRSRGLRQIGGLAEDRIWARLRGGAVDGWKVRRQHPVGRCVVDFACIPLRLVIEIDGGRTIVSPEDYLHNVVERDDIGAVAELGQAGCVNRLNPADGIALDTGHLDKAADRVAGQAQIVFERDLRGVLHLLGCAVEHSAHARSRHG